MSLEALKVAAYKRLPAALKVLVARWLTPNFTVGVVGLITRDGSSLLLVKPSYRRGWMPPGGFIARGESPTEALTREVVEELGVAMTFAEPHRVALDVARQGVSFVSLGVAPPGADFSVCSPELEDVGWFALDALPPLSQEFTEGVPEEDLEAVRAVARRG